MSSGGTEVHVVCMPDMAGRCQAEKQLFWALSAHSGKVSFMG